MKSSDSEYLYHIPWNKEILGDTLYPLNKLKIFYPKTYGKIVKDHYMDRMDLMKRVVPLLECLWNDVIHLSPVNPIKIKYFLRSLGEELDYNRFLIVPTNVINPENTVIFYNKNKTFLYDYSELKKLRNIPVSTIKYYKRCTTKNKEVLLFYGIPHVLYRGEIKISECFWSNM